MRVALSSDLQTSDDGRRSDRLSYTFEEPYGELQIVNKNVVKENQLGQSMNEIPDVGNSQDNIDNTCEDATAISRPTRSRKLPARLQDYILN